MTVIYSFDLTTGRIGTLQTSTPFVVSTPPYPVVANEQINVEQAEILSGAFRQWEIAELDILQAELTAAVLREPLVEITFGPEALDIEQAEITAGALRVALVRYTDWPPEGLDVSQAEITDGTLRPGLIRYTDWVALVEDESLDIAQAEITGGTLT